MGKKTRIIASAGQWLFILCLPVLLLTASVNGAAGSARLYNYGFDKYDISATTGLEQAELEKAARGLIDYFRSGEEYISLTAVKNGESFTLFNEREVGHLKDVKGLFNLDFRVMLGTLLYCLLFAALCALLWRDWRRLGGALLGGGVLTLALMVALGLGALFGFDELFLQFHLISFTNDLWLLDPARDYLIMLFPQGFWYDAMMVIVLATAGGAIISGAAGWLIRRRCRRLPRNHPRSAL